MKNLINILGLILIVTVISSCEKVFMKPNPETDNISIYEEYWKLVNEKFAMWNNPDKHLNKDSLYQVTRAKVSNDISSDSLFNVLGEITIRLMDGHSFIEDLESGKDLSWRIDRGETDQDTIDWNIDNDIIDNVYLKDNYKEIGTSLIPDEAPIIKYTLLENGTIGYIRIGGWMLELSNDEVNEMFDYMKDTKGLIIDVRDNPGGDPMMSTLVARHLTDKEIFIGTEYFKIGTSPDDFSKNPLYLTPIEGTKYTKPVMVLTSIWCFSATTTFTYSLLPLDYVTYIGSRTGGGSGSTADGLLANGWHWQLSVSEFIGVNGEHFDNGMEPDIEVWVNYDDPTKDEVIERAIEEINKK